jgi:(p)ppGpp synthase/HD superfamily hydrolase
MKITKAYLESKGIVNSWDIAKKFNNEQLFKRALAFAKQKHKGQKDDGGLPYIYHPQQVYRILFCVTCDVDILVAALLHDTIENTDTTYEELIKEFGQKVADLVNEVTHEGKPDSKGYYFPRLKSREAMMIKFADRLSNISRMDSWDDKRKQHYLKSSKFWRTEINI